MKELVITALVIVVMLGISFCGVLVAFTLAAHRLTRYPEQVNNVK